MSITKEDLEEALARIAEDRLRAPAVDTEMLRTLSRIQADVHIVRERLESHQEVTKKVSSQVNGNGRPGLMVRVDRIEQLVRLMLWLATPLYAGIALLAWETFIGG